MCIAEEKGGNSRIAKDDYIEGPPELALEIAGSSVAYDLHDKKQTYERNSIQEYIVWKSREQSLVWFVLQSGKYVELAPDELGIIRSCVFPGLWLNVKAFIANDLNRSVRDFAKRASGRISSGVCKKAERTVSVFPKLSRFSVKQLTPLKAD